MKVLVIGADGQLGTEICKVYADADLYQASIDTAPIKINITDLKAVRRLILEQVRPDLVINTAAAHNVPKCEEEPAKAFAVNAIAAKEIAKAAHEVGAATVHISTDYVFGEGHGRPFVETDLPAPQSTYAASKLAGEHLVAAECPRHYIVRTSGLYGTAPCVDKGGMNFVDLMLHLASEKGEVRVVTDETLTPTYTAPLAQQIRLLAEQGEPGLYHVTCNGACMWYEFALAIFEETGTDARLLKATEADFPSPVKRPKYSVLQNKRLQAQGLDIMPDWRDALRSYLAERGAAHA